MENYNPLTYIVVTLCLVFIVELLTPTALFLGLRGCSLGCVSGCPDGIGEGVSAPGQERVGHCSGF